MSTPLFIRTPTLGTGIETNVVTGQACSDPISTVTYSDLTNILVEPTLIEEVLWTANDLSTDAGMILLAIKNNGGQHLLLGAYAVPAGTASLIANGRIPVNVTLPAGYKLCAAHNVQKSASYVNFGFIPAGGAVA